MSYGIEQMGGLEIYVDHFFRMRNLPYTYQKDVRPLFEETGPRATRAKKVGIDARTFGNWEKLYKATQKV